MTAAAHSEAAVTGSSCPHRIERPIMTQVWRDAVFAHWPVPEAEVRAILPAGLEVDTLAGSAWVSLVGFGMEDLRLGALPPVPGATQFPEFNVRTYVRGPEGPGVWFCSLDVPGRLPTLVARLGFALPYCRADVEIRRGAGWERWSVARAWPGRARGSLAIAETANGSDAVPDVALTDFLTARWRLYSATRGGRIVTAPVEHEPWRLRPVRVVSADTGLAAAAGLRLGGPPAVAHRAEAVSVRVGRPRLLGRSRSAEKRLTVWFDDDCGVCTAAVTRLRPRVDATVTFRPNRDLVDPALRTVAEDAIIVTSDAGAVLTAVPAVAAVLRRGRRGERFVAALLDLPVIRSLAAIGYRWVAANRAAISARLGLKACAIPTDQAVRAERSGR